MTTSELARILNSRYATAPKGHVVTTIYLFGIEFARELDDHPLKEVCALANVPVTYATEIHKAMRLADYVSLKP